MQFVFNISRINMPSVSKCDKIIDWNARLPVTLGVKDVLIHAGNYQRHVDRTANVFVGVWLLLPKDMKLKLEKRSFEIYNIRYSEWETSACINVRFWRINYIHIKLRNINAHQAYVREPHRFNFFGSGWLGYNYLSPGYIQALELTGAPCQYLTRRPIVRSR